MSDINDRVSRHRQRARKQGFRMVHISVPDVRSAEFAKAARHQSIAAAAADRVDDTQQRFDSLSVWDDLA